MDCIEIRVRKERKKVVKDGGCEGVVIIIEGLVSLEYLFYFV